MRLFFTILTIIFLSNSAYSQGAPRSSPDSFEKRNLQEINCIAPVRTLQDPKSFFRRDYFYQRRPQLYIDAHFNKCDFKISVMQIAKNMKCPSEDRFVQVIPYEQGSLIPYFANNAKICVARKTTADDEDRFYKRGKYARPVTPSDDF